MKLIVKLEPSLKTIFKNLFARIKKYFLDLSKPKVKQEVVDTNRDLYISFEKQFGISPLYVKQIMEKVDGDSQGIKMTTEEYDRYVRYQHQQSVNDYNNFRQYNYTSGLYDPEIIDIHNESVEFLKGINIDQLKAADDKYSTTMLREQAAKRRALDVMIPRQNEPLSVDERKDLDKLDREAFQKAMSNAITGMKEFLKKEQK